MTFTGHIYTHGRDSHN